MRVSLKDEIVWLNTEALAALFNVKRPVVLRNILNNIYEDE